MIWLIVLVSINGGDQRVIERIPYKDMQSCQAEKAVRDSRPDHFVFANDLSLKRTVLCSEHATTDRSLLWRLTTAGGHRRAGQAPGSS